MLSVEDIKYRAANSPKNVSTILPKKMQSKVYSLKKKSVLIAARHCAIARKSVLFVKGVYLNAQWSASEKSKNKAFQQPTCTPPNCV